MKDLVKGLSDSKKRDFQILSGRKSTPEIKVIVDLLKLRHSELRHKLEFDSRMSEEVIERPLYLIGATAELSKVIEFFEEL